MAATRRTTPLAALAGLGLGLLLGGCASAAAVLTQHNDNGRTGAILVETVLDTTNVTPARFGRVGRVPLRGAIFAQPLYAPEVLVQGRRQDLVVVATTHNLVYALPASGAPVPLWGPVSLGPSVNLPDFDVGPLDYRDVYGEVGVMSTPVISRSDNALFVVAATKEGGKFLHRLHRLDLSTGLAQRPAVVIGAPGFESNRQNQRSALLLSQGTLYLAFAAYGDRDPYRGWVFAYDAATLTRKAVFATSDSAGGGIWMGGQGPAADQTGSVYVLTGNGRFLPAPRPLETTQLGDTFIKLSGDTLGLLSWFSPANNARLDREDGDLGGAGALLIPGTRLVVGAGKEARVFLLDRDRLGFFDAAADDRQPGVVQRFFANRDRCPTGQLAGPNCHHIHGSPVFWTGPQGSWLYVWPENAYLEAFRFDTRTGRVDCRGATDPDCDPISRSTTTDPERVPGGSFGMPGGFLSISADGSRAGTGIVWALHPYAGNANQRLVDGILRAYDASDLTRELWNTKMVPERDDLGTYPKFVAPTIAGGRVYAPTQSALTGQVLLEDSSEVSPSLAVGPGRRLFLAWTGSDGHLNLRASSDGLSFGPKRQLGETSKTHAPVLAADDQALLVAWTGIDGHLHVERSSDPGLGFVPLEELVGGVAVSPLAETSEHEPGLAVAGGRAFLAWISGGEDARLNVISAPASARGFDGADRVRFEERSLGPPHLTRVQGRLFLSWTGTDHRLNVAVLSADGRTLTEKRTLEETSNTGPALVGAVSAGGLAPDLHLFWAGTDDRSSLNVKSAYDSNLAAFTFKLTFEQRSSVRPAALEFDGRILVAWRDDLEGHHLAIARYSPGELSVYGLLERAPARLRSASPPPAP
jgi:hypothetical protein